MRAGLIALAVLVMFGSVWYLMMPLTSSTPISSVGSASGTPASFAPEVEAIIERENKLLVRIAGNQNVVAQTRTANERNKDLSAQAIQKLDQGWIAKTDSELIGRILRNDASEELVAFRSEHPEFPEVFVADAYGLNVAMTNVTSDYYQADEEWWVRGYDGGKGVVFHGPIEFDESSQTQGVTLYVPVYDGSRAIGVVKAILNLTTLKQQL